MLTLSLPLNTASMMLKKVFIVLMILLPSAVYIYLASKDAEPTKESPSAAPKQIPAQEQSQKYQTPDH
ncbi:hypothetical protein HLH17_07255 [Acinetobacter sp. ANC 5380]|uniref:Uncharacterized protein n=1 Tax=Acinetobacter terrae TaxID=2731247 RepID=A0A7Y2RER5_9GAMM|nr:hypothetical protein [Acinetobacter terrae]NNH77462.1 hypothetical protein [Acinetobacter terrae]